MITPDKAKIIERIRGCLNLGNNPAGNNQHEVETALSLAKKLMADYNLTMDDVALTESLSRTNIRQEGMRARSNIPKWEVQLARVSKNLFNTGYYIREVYIREGLHGRPAWRTQVVFYGYDADVALSIEVYKLLKMEILGMVNRWRKAHPDAKYLTPAQLHTLGHSYCDGVVAALDNRSYQKVEGLKADEAAKMRSLVVRKDDNLKEWAKAELDLRPVKWRNTGDNASHHDGLKDGQNVNLNFSNAVKGNSGTAPLQIGHKGGK